jgi:hypothetical protein
MLLTLAYAAIGSAASANVACESGSHGCALGTDAFEPGDDRREAETPLSPTDVDDDDDEQEVFTQPSHVVPCGGRTTHCGESTGETLQPSLGHQRGIDDPPRY